VRSAIANTNAYGNHHTHPSAYACAEAAPDSASSSDSLGHLID